MNTLSKLDSLHNLLNIAALYNNEDSKLKKEDQTRVEQEIYSPTGSKCIFNDAASELVRLISYVNPAMSQAITDAVAQHSTDSSLQDQVDEYIRSKTATRTGIFSVVDSIFATYKNAFAEFLQIPNSNSIKTFSGMADIKLSHHSRLSKYEQFGAIRGVFSFLGEECYIFLEQRCGIFPKSEHLEFFATILFTRSGLMRLDECGGVSNILNTSKISTYQDLTEHTKEYEEYLLLDNAKLYKPSTAYSMGLLLSKNEIMI